VEQIVSVKKVLLHMPVSRKLILILWVFVSVVIILLTLSYGAIQTLSAARAYVGGEGLWSKAQKEAVHSLVRYSASHAKEDYDRYRQALQTPLGDQKARLELEKPNPNLKVIYDGFVEGRNRPEDIDGMVKLFRRFHRTKYMAEAVTIWAEADGLIEELVRLGDDLHEQITLSKPDPIKLSEVAHQVDALGDRLTPLEDRFSYALGEGARWIAVLFLLVTCGATVASLIMGACLTLLISRHIRQTGERYKHLIDTANDAILVIDAETGMIVEANERSGQLLGMPASRLIGILGEDLCPENEREEYRGMLLDAVAGTNVTGKEMHLRNTDGRLTAVEVNTSLAELDGTKIIQGIFRDITERNRFEEDVRQAQKMEVVGRLAGGVAHDFNNLLMVILTQLSKIRSGSRAQILRHVEIIQSASLRAVSLTKQLLAFGRKQVLLLEVLDLNELIRDMRPILSTLPGHQVQLMICPSGHTLRVRVDPGKVEQVVMNLALNACDAMPTGGMLKIKTGRVERTNGTVGAPGDQTYALLEVADTGCGMESKTKAHIFEPFFTTKPTGKGTGLGLSLVYGIVKQTGGSIEVQSGVGQGTTFRVYIPLAQKAVDSAPRQEAPRILSHLAASSETILLAEDQPSIREEVRKSLEVKGYTVLEAETGTEALDVAERYPGTIDLLVTDVIMPQLRGFELARRVGQLHSKLSVVFMSGYSEEALVENGLLSRPNVSFIQKPFDPEILVVKVQQLIEGRRSQLESSQVA
jgi:PAS domain S-box-containing protein